MDFIDEALVSYSEKHSSPENSLLAKLNRETNAKVLAPRMLSGHLQGRILSMFSKMIRPKYILEIGTYTGYSALCLAEGIQDEGELHTIEVNDELTPMICEYVDASEYKNQIVIHTGDATQLIPKLHISWDLVFIDADKKNYSRYYDLIFPSLKPGGYLLADNVLWSGKVLEKRELMDDETKAIDEFNEKINNDSRVEQVLLPVRDGLLLIRKK